MNKIKNDETAERKAGGPYDVGSQWPKMINYSDTEDVRDRLDALAAGYRGRGYRVSRSALLRRLVSNRVSLADLERLYASGAPWVEDGRTDNDV